MAELNTLPEFKEFISAVKHFNDAAAALFNVGYKPHNFHISDTLAPYIGGFITKQADPITGEFVKNYL